MAEIARRNFLTGAAGTIGGAALAGTVWSAPARAAQLPSGVAATPALDSLVLGDAVSELGHAVSSTASRVISGGLGQWARVFDPLEPAQWWGGSLSATVAVAPTGTTYLTAKFWGDDRAASDEEAWRIQYVIDGRILGFLDQGFIDNADLMDASPRSPGRFFLHTIPLPEALTAGRQSISIEVRSMGRIFAYGGADTFFHPQTGTSRGVYRLYTHTTPYFEPDASDVFGAEPAPSIRPNDDAAAIATIRARVLQDQQNLIYGGGRSGMDAWAFESVARGYSWADGPGYQNPDALATVCEAIDGRYYAWKSDDAVLTASDQQWQGFGRVGLVLALLWGEAAFQLELDKPTSRGATTLANPGFEVGEAQPIGWQRFTWAGNGTFARDTTVHRTGEASLRIDPSSGSTIVGPLGHVACGPGTFTYSAWLRTDGVTTGARINALFWDAAGNLVGGDHNAWAVTGTTDWQLVTNTIAVPAGATQYEVWMLAADGSTVWFDDLVVDAPPFAASDALPRRQAYRDMLLASREYWSRNFRHYSNQAQITAIGIYQSNRGLSLISPADAWPEPQARTWVAEAIGLTPWLGPIDDSGARLKPLGEGYSVVTSAGLTRELGYVGNYGEVTDWLIMMYESIVDGFAPAAAPEVAEQIVRIIKARSRFRYSDVDAEGHRVSRLETVIGWRNEEYPGMIAYTQRTAWDSHPLQAAVTFPDAELMGWTQRMIDDGQFSPQLALLLTNTGARVGLNAMRLISRDLPAYQQLGASARALPTEWDQPDFLFTDEENGVVALKRGRELLFVSTYWRARQAVNDYARVHLIRPDGERSLTVRESSAGIPAGGPTFTVPDWVTWDYAINDGAGESPLPGGGFTPPGQTMHQALAGTVLRLAPVPSDVPDPALGATTPGVETMLVGRAPFYRLEFADYIIGQNTTSDQTFMLTTVGPGRATVIGDGRSVRLGDDIRVGPHSTVVLLVTSRLPEEGEPGAGTPATGAATPGSGSGVGTPAELARTGLGVTDVALAAMGLAAAGVAAVIAARASGRGDKA
jgi:hypothetical protein